MSDPLSGGFHYPPGSAASCNVDAQRSLWTSGRPEWRPFVSILDTAFRPGLLPDSGEVLSDLPASSFQARRVQLPNRRHYDMTFIGVCRGDHQAALLFRRIRRAIRREVTILYVGMDDRDLDYAEAIVQQAGFSDYVDILDLRCFSRTDDKVRIERQALDTWRQLNALVRDQGIYLPVDEVDFVAASLLSCLLWERACGEMEIPGRYHLRVWHEPLAAVAAWQADANAAFIESTQHSLVTCPSSFSPLPLHRMNCLGRHSARLIEHLNTDFRASVRESPRSCQYVVSHDWRDTSDRQGSRGKHILVIDQGGARWAREVFGCGEAETALARAVEAMAVIEIGVDITIRCHPFSESRPSWENIVSRYRHRQRISLSNCSLPEDLERHGICISLFSTVIPEAAASGLATLILWQPGWFFTPDLAPFEPLFRTAEELPKLVGDMVNDPQALETYRALSAEAITRYRD